MRVSCRAIVRIPFAQLLACVVWSAELACAADVPAQQVTVTTAEGAARQGSLIGWNGGRPLVMREGATEMFARDEIYRVEWPSIDRRGGLQRSLDVVRLVNGDTLMARFLGMTDSDAFRLLCDGEFELELPLEFVRSVIFAGQEGDRLPRELRTISDDVAILQNGDRIQGELLAADEAAFEWKTVLGSAKVDRAQVAAIVMNPEWLAELEQPDEFALLEMANGSVITAHEISVSSTGRLRCELAVDRSFEMATDSVLRATWYDERVRLLGERDVADFRHLPYLLGPRELAVNENAFHQPLVLGGRTYQRGFGMLSGSTLQFELADERQVFVAVVGLDDAAGSAGSVVCSVEVDGETVWTGPLQRGGEAPLRVGPVVLRGGRQLTLRVDYADYGDIRDIVNWVDPRLIRKP